MNLTKLFIAGLCLTAMTASAVDIKANAFETLSDKQQTGWYVGVDKTLESEGIVVTGDASVNGYTGLRPMTGVTSNNVLKLETGVGTWTNQVGHVYDNGSVFVDMMVKFVPSEELPFIGTDVKLAVAVQEGTPNVFAYSLLDPDSGTSNKWFVTTGAVDTNTWCRLTIELYDELNYAFVNIKTNGSLVNLTPYQVNDAVLTLNAIAFQGTGFIDEVRVRDDDPFGSTATYFADTGIEVDPIQLGNWKSDYSVGTEVAAQYAAFLMNVAPDGVVSPTLVVNSIAKGGTVTLTVKAKYTNDSLVDLGTLNNGAVLKVLGKAALPDLDWTEIGSALDFNPTTYKFFKVTVAVPTP